MSQLANHVPRRKIDDYTLFTTHEDSLLPSLNKTNRNQKTSPNIVAICFNEPWALLCFRSPSKFFFARGGDL